MFRLSMGDYRHEDEEAHLDDAAERTTSFMTDSSLAVVVANGAVADSTVPAPFAVSSRQAPRALD